MRYGIATGVRIYLDAGDTVKFAVIAIAVILLEVFLARRETWWPGLLLPAASILWAVADLVICLNSPSDASFGVRFGACLHLFFFQNIRTLVLLILYAGCRETRRRKGRRKQEIDRMHIDDI